MTQLTYEPAFDVLHTIFRALRLRDCSLAGARISRDFFRILDFYLLFPDRLHDVRLRSEHRRLKNQAVATERAAPYGSRPADIMLFERMHAFQMAALDTLAFHGFLSGTSLTDGWVEWGSRDVPTALLERVKGANERESALLRALETISNKYQFDGRDGVKDRTRLMEYRYDAV